MKEETIIKTLEVIAVVILAIVLAIIMFLLLNRNQQETIETHTWETVEPCIMDGVENCEAVRVYEGDTLKQFYIRGERKEN